MNDNSHNALEHALEQAAKEPANRPAFYQLLLESEVFALGHTESEGDGRRTLAVGEKISIVNWQKNDGTPVIPFFSSLDVLRRAIKEQQSFVAMPARSLLEVTKGATLVLNPGSSYSKEFFPHEIEAMLATGVNHVAQSRVVQKPTQVLLGQPANHPSEMIAALTKLLAKHPSVKAAYLCLMHDPSTQEKPSLVVGFEGEALERAMQEAGSVAADTAPKGVSVDFIKIVRGGEGLSAYFLKSVQPFYERAERTWGPS
ncbi:enhanced serine sensitivity protein SseB C-terminal domain-containing protein [Rhodanobacter sp. Si-c]|uniref:Enhanced serine sensitivity protein SseB C-terminal domain-containing protein n=1 Tax=Rhodanobacter lycopersici TaxID=3162487 RepID=A0ABV3QEI9_9GAMM